eukprot:15347861-Ditylum_brightwellii.AAC.1
MYGLAQFVSFKKQISSFGAGSSGHSGGEDTLFEEAEGKAMERDTWLAKEVIMTTMAVKP